MKQSLSMPIRIVLVLAVALIVWIVGVMVGQENTVTILNPDTSYTGMHTNTQGTVNIMIDYNNGDIATYNNLPLATNHSLWAVVKRLADQEHIPLSYNDDFDTVGLQWWRLAGRGNVQGGIQWHVWVNNVYQNKSWDKIELKPGDIVSFKHLYYQVND
ncbi:MAG: hypothetical protein ACKKL5_01160 [Candidatus Komeilibacteria bacterium]